MTTLKAQDTDAALRTLIIELAHAYRSVVTLEAVWSNVAKRHEDGGWLYHVTEVLVFPAAQFNHLWLLGLPNSVRRKLYEGTKFTFRGEVVRYVRLDKSEDYGISYVGGLNVVRG